MCHIQLYQGKSPNDKNISIVILLIMMSYLNWSGDQTNGLVFPSAGDNAKSLNSHVLLPNRSLKLGSIISRHDTCYWVDRPYDWDFHLQSFFKEDEITKNSHVSFWGSDTLTPWLISCYFCLLVVIWKFYIYVGLPMLLLICWLF